MKQREFRYSRHAETIEPLMLSAREAAKLLGSHAVSVSRLARQGRLPAEKVANRWLIPRALVEEFAKTYEGRRGRPTGWSKQKGGRP